MNLDRFTGPGSTPARRRFWDKVQEAVMASRKVAGRNVTIDEHSGAGSVINTPDRTRTAGGCNPANCPPTPGPCTLDLSVSTPHGYSVSETDLLIANGDCGFIFDTGWHSCDWSSCGDCSGCNVTAESCQCGFSASWVDVAGIPGTGKWVIFDLNLIVGDSQLTPDGWWLSAAISDDSCYYGNCSLPVSGFCTECFVYLGASSSIFSTDLMVSMNIPSNSGCGPDVIATLDLTFHPCS